MYHITASTQSGSVSVTEKSLSPYLPSFLPSPPSPSLSLPLSPSLSGFTSFIPPLYLTGQLLLVVGYLPQGYSFYLNEENMNLQLLKYTVDMLEGVELAVTRSVIATSRFTF